jgi:hypothetical protein
MKKYTNITNLLNSGDAVLYGRITYQLMEYWQTLLKNPSCSQGFSRRRQVIAMVSTKEIEPAPELVEVCPYLSARQIPICTGSTFGMPIV